MIKLNQKETVLFDLDGTLLPIDFDIFLENYFQALTKEFTDLAPPEKFIKALMKATEEMIGNNGQQTNQKVFINSFFSLIEAENQTEIMERFDKFYAEKFPQLKEEFDINTTSNNIIKILKEADFQLIIATNPLFPREAIIERINWAGLNPSDFDLITTYEIMHYSKPNLKYYQEIMNKLSLIPEDCILVGNNLQEDIIAGQLGIETFLIEDYLIDDETENIIPDWRGTLADFRLLLEDKLKKE